MSIEHCDKCDCCEEKLNPTDIAIKELKEAYKARHIELIEMEEKQIAEIRKRGVYIGLPDSSIGYEK